MLAQTFLPEFDHEMSVTRKALERVPDEKFDWRPHPKSYTLGELTSHLPNLLTWTAMTIDQTEFVMDSDNPPPPQPAAANRDEALKMFDENVTAARAKIAGASDEQLMQTWTMKVDDRVIVSMPKIAVLKAFILNHSIHHRAQLGLYLRLNDVPVPPMYGPSADESGM
jgi:uncharacterized damage-inducible protein DinB